MVIHMGRHKGSKPKLRRSGPLDEQHEELVWNLVEAYPDPVPYDRLFHLSTGEWSLPPYGGFVVCEVRKHFGFDAIETVRERGYRASERLVRAAAKVKADEAEQRVLSKLGR